MSKTLLDGVNEVLKKVNVITTGTLFSSLTDSAQQHEIDIAVQIINEGIDELFSVNAILPQSSAESTITLVTGQREYSLASDFIEMNSNDEYPIIDRTNFQYLAPFDAGYDAMLIYDPQQTFTGLPKFWAISPVNGKLRVEIAPDASSNGRVYTYEYTKNTTLTSSTDPMPFNDEVFRAMVPAWAEAYNLARKKEFNQAAYMMAMGRATRAATPTKARDRYGAR